MAKRVIHELIDDLDGSVAAETVDFGLDGISYEIDVSTANAAKLRDALAPYVDAATKLGRGGPRLRLVRSAPTRTTADRERLTAIRAWARSNDYEISDRGRISSEITEAYENAQKNPVPAKRTRARKPAAAEFVEPAS